MSKIIEALRKATNQKYSARHSQAINKNGATEPERSVILAAQSNQTKESVSIPNTFQPKLTNAPSNATWIISLVITISLVALVGINLSLLKKYTSANTNNATRLGRLEELLNKNNQQLAAFSNRIKEQESEIKKLSQQTKESQNLISLMEKNNNAQRTSIENLTKAKNSIFKKIEDLYKEIDTLKGSGSIAGKPPAP